MVASTLVAPGPTTSMRPAADQRLLASVVVAMLAFAGGLIHAAVIRHHLAYFAVATGFAAMAGAQWWFAFRMLRRPTNRVRLLGVALHSVVVATWLLSRAVGLASVAGVERPAPVGVADVTANLYSILVVAVLARTWWSTRRGRRPLVLGPLAGPITALVAVGVLLATAPAVLADHDHGNHERPAGHQPVDDGHHDEHGHDHG